MTRSVLITYDPKNRKAAQFIATAKMMDFFRVEPSPYNPQFVAKINRSRASESHPVDVSRIWE